MDSFMNFSSKQTNFLFLSNNYFFSSLIGIRPAICGSPLCVMSYEELGVGIDLQHEIIANPLLIDLFIALLSFATINFANKRINLMFPSSVKAYENGVEKSFTLHVCINKYNPISFMIH